MLLTYRKVFHWIKTGNRKKEKKRPFNDNSTALGPFDKAQDLKSA
jgi:hypothetical protein